MKVKVAKTAGFCFGVKRAVDLVYTQCEESHQVYTYGPIIHNEEVIRDLERKGVRVINTQDELMQLGTGTVIIRSHGVSKRIYDILTAKDIKVVDATCPFVRKIHRIVEECSLEGQDVIIIGNDAHPEVEGIKGWCMSNVYVVQSVEDVKDLTICNDKICVVSQTTFNYKQYFEIVNVIKEKYSDAYVINTICNATHERQEEAISLAKESDVMIVIGGKNSSNTQKLFNICEKECSNTFYIQKSSDIELEKIDSDARIGITAGASTPNNIIKEVFDQCQK